MAKNRQKPFENDNLGLIDSHGVNRRSSQKEITIDARQQRLWDLQARWIGEIRRQAKHSTYWLFR